MKIIKLSIVILSISFLLMACQPQARNTLAQKQNFVCKSLIEGFLKTQLLGQYQLLHIQPTLHQTSAQRLYKYQISSDQQMRINMPQQQDLNFQCNQTSAQHFELKLLNHEQQEIQSLLTLDLLPQQTIDDLTAFALKTE
ncbi:hypothetical protein B9T25_09050 [Acinetobacter sp. ANC 4470]|uniref:hypothetical protein n=1 Tax=Acinetobacter sp. ANC 4470 TaxID=1977881 RepID=UPI000A339ED5|nr:hypothetical protein [Acinetobacter sp. ANC 4470]OTG66915.1 hypothetical protein B9T25_09050 [Acinetobacter sp. ANC 4470]